MISATELQTSSECAYQPLTKGMEMNNSWLHQQIGKNSGTERARYCHQWSWVSVWRLPGLAQHQLFQLEACSVATFRLASKYSSLHLQTDFAAPACSGECTQQKQLVPGTRFALLGLWSLSPARCCFLFTVAFSRHFLLFYPRASTIIVSHLYPERRQRTHEKLKCLRLPKMILNYEAFPEQAPYLLWHWSSQDTSPRKYHTTFI